MIRDRKKFGNKMEVDRIFKNQEIEKSAGQAK